MSSVIAGAVHVWPWIAGGSAIAGAIWRWWRGRAPTRSRLPARYESTEDVMFPDDGSSPRPLRGLARWLSAPLLLTLKEAGDDATASEMAGLRADLKRVLEDNTRLRAELDGLVDSNAGYTDMGTGANRRLRPPSPRSPKSDA